MGSRTARNENAAKWAAEAGEGAGHGTMNAAVMTNPGLVPGDHDVFISGNDASAKAAVSELLRAFGWAKPIDLGDIGTARSAEMILPLWLRLMSAFKSPAFNFHFARS